MSITVPAPAPSDFYRRFVDRVRETVAPEQHSRTADTAPTPEQVEAMAEIDRIFAASPDRAGVAQRVLDLIAVEKCTVLAGQCVEHEDDHGEIIHSGSESSITVGECSDLMSFRLRKWGDDKPYITFGWDGIELDLAGVDTLIADMRTHLAALVVARNHLAAALGGAR